MLVTLLVLIFAGMFLDPLRWILAFVMVAVVRNLDRAFKMSFIKMVCSAIFVAIVLEANLQTIPDSREFSVGAVSVSAAVSLLIIWLINLALTLLFRNSSSK